MRVERILGRQGREEGGRRNKHKEEANGEELMMKC